MPLLLVSDKQKEAWFLPGMCRQAEPCVFAAHCLTGLLKRPFVVTLEHS